VGAKWRGGCGAYVAEGKLKAESAFIKASLLSGVCSLPAICLLVLLAHPSGIEQRKLRMLPIISSRKPRPLGCPCVNPKHGRLDDLCQGRTCAATEVMMNKALRNTVELIEQPVVDVIHESVSESTSHPPWQ
jgi:hypothetical protein